MKLSKILNEAIATQGPKIPIAAHAKNFGDRLMELHHEAEALMAEIEKLSKTDNSLRGSAGKIKTFLSAVKKAADAAYKVN